MLYFILPTFYIWHNFPSHVIIFKELRKLYNSFVEKSTTSRISSVQLEYTFSCFPKHLIHIFRSQDLLILFQLYHYIVHMV